MSDRCSVMPDSLQPYGLLPPGSSVHDILPARILEWVAISHARGPFPPRGRTVSPASPALAGRFFTTAPPGKLGHDVSYVSGGAGETMWEEEFFLLDSGVLQSMGSQRVGHD